MFAHFDAFLHRRAGLLEVKARQALHGAGVELALVHPFEEIIQVLESAGPPGAAYAFGRAHAHRSVVRLGRGFDHAGDVRGLARFQFFYGPERLDDAQCLENGAF